MRELYEVTYSYKNVTELISNVSKQDISELYYMIHHGKNGFKDFVMISDSIEKTNFVISRKSINYIKVEKQVSKAFWNLREIDNKLRKLRLELIDNTFSLWELDNRCIEITESDKPSIYKENYDKEQILEIGGFVWGSELVNKDIFKVGIYFVEFEVLDFDNHEVRVTDVYYAR